MDTPVTLSQFPTGQRPYEGDAPTPMPVFRAGVSAFNPWWLVFAVVLVALSQRR